MLRTIRRSPAFLGCFCAIVLGALPVGAQNPIWIRQLGTSHEDFAFAAAVDGSGGVYVGGRTDGNLGGPNAGGADAWFARYDSAGHQLWIRHLGTSAVDISVAVAPDASGGVYVSGYTTGSLGGPNLGGFDVWLARYDSAGNQLWIRQVGTADDEYVHGAAPDGSGGVYLSGDTNGSFAGPNAGASDAWLAHYDSAGNQVWVRQLGTNARDEATAAASDRSGGVYVGGFTDGNLGGLNAGSDDGWLAHYDGAGNQIWIRQFGTTRWDEATAAAPDGSGGVYLGGITGGSLGGPHAGVDDAWLAHYDSAGNQTWIRQFGTSATDDLWAAAPDGSGGAYVCGVTDGSLAAQNLGGDDAWFAHYDGAGNRVWIRQIRSSGFDRALAAAPDGSGGLYVSGDTSGSLGGPNAGSFDAWVARVGSSVELLCEPGIGGVIPCPCSNAPIGLGHGCDNSDATGGATIQALGADSLAADSLAFVASGEKPTALSLLLQGTTASSSGVVYGQGVRCVAGTLKRLFNHNASGGVSTLPDFTAGDTTISARSSALGNPINAGESRWYLVYYRDPVVLGGCPASSTFNSGPTMRADWGP